MRELRLKVESAVRDNNLLVTTALLNDFETFVQFLEKFSQSQLLVENCQIRGADEVTPNQLIIEGRISQPWPIKGFHSEGLKNIITQLEFRRDSDISPVVAFWRFAGALTIANTAVVLAGDVVNGAMIEMNLGQNRELKFSLAQIAEFSIPTLDVTNELPNIPIFREITLTSLKLLFGFSPLDRSSVNLIGVIAENWGVVKNLFTLRDISVYFGADYRPGPDNRLRIGYHGYVEGQIGEGNLQGRINFQDTPFAELAVTASTGKLSGLQQWAQLTNEAELVGQFSQSWPELNVEKMEILNAHLLSDWATGELTSIRLLAKTLIGAVPMELEIQLPGCEFGGSWSIDPQLSDENADGLLADLGLPPICSGLSLTEVNLMVWPKKGVYSFHAQTNEWSLTIGRYIVLFTDFELEWYKNMQGTKSVMASCTMYVKRGSRISQAQLRIDFTQSQYSLSAPRSGSKIADFTIRSDPDFLDFLQLVTTPPKVSLKSGNKTTIRRKRKGEKPLIDLNAPNPNKERKIDV